MYSYLLLYLKTKQRCWENNSPFLELDDTASVGEDAIVQEQKKRDDDALARLEAFGVEVELKKAPEAPLNEVEPQVAQERPILESSVDQPLESSVDAQVDLKASEGKQWQDVCMCIMYNLDMEVCMMFSTFRALVILLFQIYI